jgi:hypothetical protein
MPALDYESLIREVSQILTRHEVRMWKDRATEWLLSLPRAYDRPDAWAGHAQTVLQSFGGMGSINDVYISPKAGDSIADDPIVIREVNRELKLRLSQLYVEARRLASV